MIYLDWVDIKDGNPRRSGTYLVRRQWSENTIATGQAYFDGMFWHPKIMEELSGPITGWKEILEGEIDEMS